ncbi:MAG: glycerol-3-phosphate 1-O-acyltransferase PlsY [Phycisphaerae bacterium]
MSGTQVQFITFVSVVAAYLIGSIPFGLLLGLLRGVDIRTQGSGNIGATNAARVLGMRYFWYTFGLDFTKGFLPVLAVDLVVRHWHGPVWIALGTAAAAICGHVFPCYLRFKGGKGVATTFGVVLGIWPVFTLSGLGAAIIFLFVFLAYRMISLSSLMGAVVFMILIPVIGHDLGPVLGVLYPQPWNQLMPLLITGWLMGLLIIIKHRGNIRRLLNGTEPRMGEKHK